MRYKKNSTLPEGMTEFKLDEADLRLRSTALDWLVIASTQTSAIYRGSGVINEQLAPNGTPYKFTVWAINGDPLGQPDAFHIRIWWVDDGGVTIVVYDNGSLQTLGGGSIVVHKAK